jgi:hypothetical protein
MEPIESHKLALSGVAGGIAMPLAFFGGSRTSFSTIPWSYHCCHEAKTTENSTRTLSDLLVSRPISHDDRPHPKYPALLCLGCHM